MTHRTTARVGAVAAAAALLLPQAVQALAPTPGSDGAGDPYFPTYGNGGYDVSHYDIFVDYKITTRQLQGDTTIEAKATQDLSSFNLDLALPASEVLVDSSAATFTQSGQELTVTPSAPILDGQSFVVDVQYAGDPAAATGQTLGGWFLTSDGAVAAGEPEVATVWYPSNDHPSDKAAFDIRVRATKAKEVISNGVLVSRSSAGGKTVWHWQMPQPMTTYLATVVIGDYRITKGRSPGGVPYLNAVTEHLSDKRRVAVRRSLEATPAIVDYFSKRFGKYPFDITGGTAVNATFGFSLENQSRPNYSKVFFGNGPAGVNTGVVSHELAHMWWGDSVSVANWKDIWLNEGFATWSSWLWATHEQPRRYTLNRIFADDYAFLATVPSFWKVRVDDPGSDRVFDGAVYERGALALQALRNKIGAAKHDRLLKTWARTHRYANGSVAEFKALAEQVSGKQLDTFFAEWIHQTNRPRPSKALGFPPSMLGRPVTPKPMSDLLRQSLRQRT